MDPFKDLLPTQAQRYYFQACSLAPKPVPVELGKGFRFLSRLGVSLDQCLAMPNQLRWLAWFCHPCFICLRHLTHLHSPRTKVRGFLFLPGCQARMIVA